MLITFRWSYDLAILFLYAILEYKSLGESVLIYCGLSAAYQVGTYECSKLLDVFFLFIGGMLEIN